MEATASGDRFFVARRDEVAWTQEVLDPKVWWPAALHVDAGSAGDTSFAVHGTHFRLELDPPCLVVHAHDGRLEREQVLAVVDLIAAQVHRATGREVRVFGSAARGSSPHTAGGVPTKGSRWPRRAAAIAIWLVAFGLAVLPLPQGMPTRIRIEGQLGTKHFAGDRAYTCLLARPLPGDPELEAACRSANAFPEEQGRLRIGIGGSPPNRATSVWSKDGTFEIHVYAERPRWASLAGYVDWLPDWHPSNVVDDLVLLHPGEPPVAIPLPSGTVTSDDDGRNVTWNVGQL
ncbi:MAG: hypothetical protein AB7T63_05865 [Planctomycetota bacterium]